MQASESVGVVVGAHPTIALPTKSWIYHSNTLYIEDYYGICPNIVKRFARVTNIDYNAFLQSNNNDLISRAEFITNFIVPSDTLVAASDCVTKRQVSFLTVKPYAVSVENPTWSSNNDIYSLVSVATGKFPTLKVTSKIAQITLEGYARGALNKLTGALVIISCLVILLTSYYNAYKIVTGK
jgi:hypothetical protein